MQVVGLVALLPSQPAPPRRLARISGMSPIVAVADLLDQRLARRRMAALQPGGDLDVLLLRLLARAEQPVQAARIGRERLFHEDVDALSERRTRRAPAGCRPASCTWRCRPGGAMSIALR